MQYRLLVMRKGVFTLTISFKESLEVLIAHKGVFPSKIWSSHLSQYYFNECNPKRQRSGTFVVCTQLKFKLDHVTVKKVSIMYRYSGDLMIHPDQKMRYAKFFLYHC